MEIKLKVIGEWEKERKWINKFVDTLEWFMLPKNGFLLNGILVYTDEFKGKWIFLFGFGIFGSSAI